MTSQHVDPAAQRARRRQATFRDMALSIAVLMVPVVLLSWLFSRTPEPQAQAVDWRAAYAAAKADADYTVLAPQKLPESWVPTVARFTSRGKPLVGGEVAPGDTWQLGYLSPEGVYIGLTQRDELGQELIDDVSRQGVEDGWSTVNGALWERYVSPDGRTRLLVAVSPDVTTVVAGDTSYQGLEAYASTLG